LINYRKDAINEILCVPRRFHHKLSRRDLCPIIDFVYDVK
jgi:hypothetical protein